MSTGAAARRGRGRPRAGEPSGRERILAAASEEFAEQGYDGATTRAIAARAGVDAAAIHHHFGTKSDLFSAVIDIPLRPDRALPDILDGPLEEIGERIVRYVLTSLESPGARRRAITMMRTGLGNRTMTPLMAKFFEREVISKVAARLSGDDVELRATLVGSQVGGMLMVRYVLRVKALADAPGDVVDRGVGAAIQTYLVG